MGYVTRFSPAARRELNKVPRADALRILYRLAELQKAMDQGDTAHLDIKAFQGSASRWRLRVGDYRAVYTIEDGLLVLLVIGVGNRREVYRRM
ncbi:type II toxin-antitoxin system RelE/ParE family toxin [Streptomyces sp. NPDC087440]|uniref:type II toxin-antitoxin system RelE family toxin n=1 Tax=Streptomyces sp. NPDC087440 TaxID=3365790 RepID=UPI00380874C6